VKATGRKILSAEYDFDDEDITYYSHDLLLLEDDDDLNEAFDSTAPIVVSYILMISLLAIVFLL